MVRGQKVAVPNLRAGVRQVFSQHDERREIRVERAQPVTEPRTDARQWNRRGTGVHRQRCLEMLDDVGVQRADHTEFVGDGLEIGKQFADHQTGFARARELEWRTEQRERFGFVRAQAKSGDRLAMLGAKPGFGIERVQVRKSAGEKDEEQLLGLRLEVRRFGGERMAVVQRCGKREFRIKAERARRDTAGGALQESATIELERWVHPSLIAHGGLSAPKTASIGRDGV